MLYVSDPCDLYFCKVKLGLTGVFPLNIYCGSRLNRFSEAVQISIPTIYMYMCSLSKQYYDNTPMLLSAIFTAVKIIIFKRKIIIFF